MPFYESLEDFYEQIDNWQVNENVSKQDILRNCRSRITALISELLSAPQIGTAFAHPSDTMQLSISSDLEQNRLEFEPDDCGED
jgi:hypothetical protein